MIPISLAELVRYNGGNPVIGLEEMMLPLAVRDLDPLVKKIGNRVSQAAVKDALRPLCLPAEWRFGSDYARAPHVHLLYEGHVGIPLLTGAGIDVFISIATGRTGSHSTCGLSLRDLPQLGQRGHFVTDPFNRPAAWLTLFVTEARIPYTYWRTSHQVQGFLTLDGEFPRSALMTSGENKG